MPSFTVDTVVELLLEDLTLDDERLTLLNDLILDDGLLMLPSGKHYSVLGASFRPLF